MIDLGKVVILSGEPEDRYGRDAVRFQMFRHFHGCQGFENGVGGTGEQAYLLTGNDRYRAGLRELFKGGRIAILLAQRVDDSGALIVREGELAGSGDHMLRFRCATGVEAANFLKIVEIIGEEPGRAGNEVLANTGRLHIDRLLRDDSWLSKVTKLSPDALAEGFYSSGFDSREKGTGL